MYVPRWLGYAVPRQTLDGLWGCLRLRLTCELVDWASREWADPSSLQDTREEWRLTLTQGWRAWSCNISSLGPQTFGFEPELHHAHSCIFICAVQMSSCHVSLHSCWVPSPWVSLSPPQPWFFSGKAWWTGDELALFLCLKFVAPAQGRAVDTNPGAPGPGCPAVLGYLAASGQVGRWAVPEWAGLERKCRLLCGRHWRPGRFSSWSSFPVNSGFQQW